MQLLLRAIRTPLVQISPDNRHYFGATGAPSFLSAGLPRDRRGRIARKLEAGGGGAARAEDDARGEDTPRIGAAFGGAAREREMQLLASLRSAFISLLCVCALTDLVCVGARTRRARGRAWEGGVWVSVARRRRARTTRTIPWTGTKHRCVVAVLTWTYFD